MRKKEDIGLGSITTNAVADITSYATAGEFISNNLAVLVVVILLVGFVIGGIVFLIKQHRHVQRILAGIPHDKREHIEKYIKSTLAKGFTKYEVRKALIASGWKEDQAEALLYHI